MTTIKKGKRKRRKKKKRRVNQKAQVRVRVSLKSLADRSNIRIRVGRKEPKIETQGLRTEWRPPR